MKILAPLLPLLLLSLGACSDGDDDRVATDPGPAVEPAEQQGPPAAPGPVRTRGPVTVLQQPGRDVEVCLGVSTMVVPPTCTGPVVEGWDWETTGQGMSQEDAGTRWGSFALTGTWDGAVLRVSDAVPAALYDAAPLEEPTLPPVSRAITGAGRAEIADEAGNLPGALAATPTDERVLVDVAYDDGSIQAYADRAWGEGVVVVNAALVDAG